MRKLINRRPTVAVLCILLLLLSGCRPDVQNSLVADGTELLVYCGAGLREPMTELAGLFEDREHICITYTFAGSAQLLAQAELSGQGDLLVLGAKSYYDLAEEKALLLRGRMLSCHVPVLVVDAKNPLQIHDLEDLKETKARLVLGEPDANAAGKAAAKILDAAGLDLEAQIVGYCATTNELGTQVALGAADACISMQDQVVGDESLLAIQIPEALNQKMLIPAGVLSVTEHPLESEKFLDFLASEEAVAVWERYGFPAYEGETR